MSRKPSFLWLYVEDDRPWLVGFQTFLYYVKTHSSSRPLRIMVEQSSLCKNSDALCDCAKPS